MTARSCRFESYRSPDARSRRRGMRLTASTTIPTTTPCLMGADGSGLSHTSARSGFDSWHPPPYSSPLTGRSVWVIDSKTIPAAPTRPCDRDFGGAARLAEYNARRFGVTERKFESRIPTRRANAACTLPCYGQPGTEPDGFSRSRRRDRSRWRFSRRTTCLSYTCNLSPGYRGHSGPHRLPRLPRTRGP